MNRRVRFIEQGSWRSDLGHVILIFSKVNAADTRLNQVWSSFIRSEYISSPGVLYLVWVIPRARGTFNWWDRSKLWLVPPSWRSSYSWHNEFLISLNELYFLMSIISQESSQLMKLFWYCGKSRGRRLQVMRINISWFSLIVLLTLRNLRFARCFCLTSLSSTETDLLCIWLTAICLMCRCC